MASGANPKFYWNKIRKSKGLKMNGYLAVEIQNMRPLGSFFLS